MRATLRALLVGSVTATVVGAVAQAGIRVPTTSGGPFYARIELDAAGAPLVHHDGEWAVLPFYRSPDCVREDFNLLDFFDFANIPAIFGCELTVAGFEIYEAAPGPGATPRQVIAFGLEGMPVWFVPWSELEAAMADGVLTIVELRGLPGLVEGSASFFKETLHPFGGAVQVKLQMVGWGTLEDGRSFRFTSEETHGVVTQTQIEIR
jgi:hypothetical protein